MFRSSLFLVLAVFGSVSRADVIAYINDGGGNIDRLAALGHSITYFNDPINLSLAQLAGFDVLMITSNGPFAEPVNIGNVAADFADAGGGVVLTMFSIKGSNQVGGRIATPAYSPFLFDPFNSFTTSSSVAVATQPNHQIFNGVNVDNLTSGHVAQFIGLNPGAQMLMTWVNTAGVASMSLPSSNVVALNLFPGDNWTLYQPNADNDRLLSNALSFSNVVVPEPSLLTPLAIGCAMFCARRRR